MLKFKAGDKVKVTLGKDKGREGVIERVYSEKSKALIPEINVVKKHVKGVSGQKGGIYDIPKPIHFSKFSLVCPKCSKVARVGFKKVGDEKLRFCKKCGREIDSNKK
jgi:large subunit ribosomal protein L24